jgi:ribosomal protein S18 acetylase RimI-like enzyme
MGSRVEPIVRVAGPDDVAAICKFGETYVPPHCSPLVGAAAAAEQVRAWWNETYVSRAVAQGLVVVGTTDGVLIGVAQRGRRGEDHVIYKLYVHPQHRSGGLGRRLVNALIAQLPASTDRVYVEQFVSNERAGAFYEREGFVVDTVEPSRSGDPRAATVWRVRHFPRS